MRQLSTLAPLALIPLTAFGQASKPLDPKAVNSKIEKSIATHMAELHIPGASLVIVRDGKVVLIRGFGKRDLAQALPVTPDTLFAIGSSTKAFTAALITMAQDEGKLSLTDSPKKYLPYFQLADPESDQKITIADLLSHRSGVARTDLVWYSGVLNSEEAIRSLATAKPTAKIGKKFQYQNLMFDAAGQIAGTVEGATWEDLLKSRILDPLQMNETNTSVATTLTSKDHSHGYQFVDKSKAWIELPMRDLPSVAPAGAINSNAKDMGKWVQFMLNGGVAGDKRLISEKGFDDLSAAHMAMGGTANYGYGWMLHDWHGHKVVEHGGNIDGFNAEVALLPDQHLGFALLTNVSSSPLGSMAMEDIWSAFVPVKEDKPADKAAVADHPENEVGEYYLAIAKANFAIHFKEKKLTVHPDGQPEMELKTVGGRRYTLLPPAPPNVFITFRPTKDDLKQTEMVVEQSGATFVLQKPKPYIAPISVDDLMAKVIAAQGDENIRKHHSVAIRFRRNYENQGMTSAGIVYKQAPNMFSEFEVVSSVGKKIFWTHDCFDGVAGAQEASFASTTVFQGNALLDQAAISTFNGILDWKKVFSKVAIIKLDKVGDEQVYVLQKTLPSGANLSDYVSTKTFQILKSESGGGSQTMSDFRTIDGMLVPFKIVRDDPQYGSVIWTADDVVFDQPVPAETFKFSAAKLPKLIVLH